MTALLVKCTQDSYLRYSKARLNKAYLHEKAKGAILDAMEGIDWHSREGI